MAHGRQEVGLGLGRRLRRLARLDQIKLHLLAVGDIGECRHEAARRHHGAPDVEHRAGADDPLGMGGFVGLGALGLRARQLVRVTGTVIAPNGGEAR